MGVGLYHRMALAGLLAMISACTSVDIRPEPSTLGCGQAVVRQVPEELDDKQRHCVAAALIARQCSPLEATLLALAKEARDLFGRGDAEWADWQADRTGIRCASALGQDVAACCAKALANGLRD